LKLPFNGNWKVTNGGKTVETNNHADPERSPKSMQHAYDFRLEHIRRGERLSDYEVFGREVISPADGKVIQIINGAIDVLPGEKDRGNGVGNMIITDYGNGEFGMICHLKFNSIKVTVGDEIKQGQVIGLCGNTGNTSEPHVHFQLQDGPFMHNSNALLAQFRKIIVDGETKENYEPIRGEMVSNAVL
jgi:biotin carboxyl carrier protein